MTKKFISILFLVVSLFYILHGLDLTLLIHSIKSYSPLVLILTMFATVFSFVLIAVRWSFLSNTELTVKASFESSIICAGINNVTPARIGDLSRVFYLNRVYNFSVIKSLTMTLLERLFDLIGLLVIGSLLAFYAGNIKVYIFPLLLLVAICCGILFFIIKNPLKVIKRIRRFKWKKLKLFVIRAIIPLSRLKSLFFIKLFILTIVIWLYYIFVLYLFVNQSLTIHLSVLQIMIVFIISALGVSLPSTPASIGIYEASIVISMGWFGVDKGTALSLALVYHLIQILSTVVITFLIMYVKDYKNLSLFKKSQLPI